MQETKTNPLGGKGVATKRRFFLLDNEMIQLCSKFKANSYLTKYKIEISHQIFFFKDEIPARKAKSAQDQRIKYAVSNERCGAKFRQYKI